ncbi:MAG TPA: UDP-N-acetylmuramoyl-L-alanine--D-glutamate ligase, partial [Thermoanaerobaculia bacterium]
MSKYLVVGAGKSGVAAANFLVARGEEVSITDSSPHPDVPFPLDDRVRRFFGYHDEAALNGATTVIVSPGVPL